MSDTPKRQHWKTRILRLMFVAIPGAYCAAMGGSSLGAALFGPDYDEGLWLGSLLIVPGSFLLLRGTGTTREPLFLLVFLPAPIILSAGFHLRKYHSEAFWPLSFVGITMPLIVYPLVSYYYRRRRPRDVA